MILFKVLIIILFKVLLIILFIVLFKHFKKNNKKSLAFMLVILFFL
jgi:hypothetical protein